jgi:hypothetical protein
VQPVLFVTSPSVVLPDPPLAALRIAQNMALSYLQHTALYRRQGSQPHPLGSLPSVLLDLLLLVPPLLRS